jgi:hypothetical protein
VVGVGVEFLSDGQAAAFGRFSGVPTREQLERYFLLDDADRALARYGMAAKAQAIGRLSPARRAATLLAVAKHLETVANDDALDLFEALAAQLAGRSAREGDKDRLRQLPLLAEASASLAVAVGVLFDADESLSVREVWDAIEAQVPRAELVTATSTVADLASEVDRDDAMRAQLVDRYLTARRFLPRLIDTVTYEATPAGAEILAAVEGLGGLWGRKKVSAADVALGVVPAAWRRLVLPEPGEVDRRAYTLCVMEELHQALRRRDVFCPASSRWADPRACLLDGERWAAMRPELLDGLGLDPDPSRHLEALSAKLDDAMKLYELEAPSARDKEDAVRPGPPYRVAAEKIAETLGLSLTDEQLERASLGLHYGSALRGLLSNGAKTAENASTKPR